MASVKQGWSEERAQARAVTWVRGVSAGDLRPDGCRLAPVDDTELALGQHRIHLACAEGNDAGDEEKIGELCLTVANHLRRLERVDTPQPRRADRAAEARGGARPAGSRQPQQAVRIYFERVTDEATILRAAQNSGEGCDAASA